VRILNTIDNPYVDSNFTYIDDNLFLETYFIDDHQYLWIDEEGLLYYSKYYSCFDLKRKYYICG